MVLGSTSATFYANEVSAPIASIFSDASNNHKVGVSTTAGYIPDNMEQAASYFRQGLYKNTLTVLVGEEGTLKIGLKKTKATTNDWTIFDNFTLSYLGKQGDVNVDGRVDISDVTSLVNVILQKAEETKTCDVNLSKSIDISDVTSLVNIILGK